MPANVIFFKDYTTLPTKPSRLYCDTNFLIRLLFYNDNATNQSKLTTIDRDCYQFYTQVKQNSGDLVTSVYGFSELMHFYFFWYNSDGMYKLVKRFFSQNSITFTGSIHEQYKHFVKNYPSDFQSAFRRISHRIAKADKFLDQIGVKILYPLPSPHLTNISKNIVDYATVLLDAFPKLEANDAIHLSVADYLNIPYVISMDEAFKDVDGFTIFTLN